MKQITYKKNETFMIIYLPSIMSSEHIAKFKNDLSFFDGYGIGVEVISVPMKIFDGLDQICYLFTPDS